jgi:ribonuclease E/ribonuclease G
VTVEIHLAVGEGVRIAAAVGPEGAPLDLLAEPVDRPWLTGSARIGRVLRVDRATGAAFVEIGAGRPALLAMGGRPLAPGEDVLCQVTAEARGAKGFAATRDIALPGRFLLRTPFAAGLRFSAAFPREERGHWQGRLPEGWLVRSAAAAADQKLVWAEAERLDAAWRRIEARSRAGEGPAEVAPAPGPAGRLILDNAFPAAILVEDRAELARVRALLAERAPDLADRARPAPTFILDQLPGLLEPSVPLPGGGRIVIEATTALTAIDVDAGDARDPAEVNRRAAVALARQLRLRNIGGIVVVDTISTRGAKAAATLLGTFRHALAADPAQIHLPRAISPLGLIELARERRGLSLAEALEAAGPA